MKQVLNTEELVKTWKEEERRPFTGWDFSYLDGRMIEELPGPKEQVRISGFTTLKGLQPAFAFPRMVLD